jgi:hypothetical protein
MRIVSTGTIATAVTALLAAGLAAAITAAPAAQAAQAAQACPASWKLVAEPATTGSDQLYSAPEAGASDAEFAPDTALDSESILGNGDAWFFGVNGYNSGPWTLHWNGRSVSSAAMNLPEGYYYDGAGGSGSFDSDSDGWLISGIPPVVEGSVDETAEWWHDGRWTMTPMAVSPQPGTQNVSPQAVASLSPGDAWAVGEFSSTAIGPGIKPDGALIEHWNGTSWDIVANPASSSPATELLGVTAASPDEVWAAGFQAHGKAGFLPLVEHFDGTKWTELPPVPVTAGYKVASAISVSAAGGGVWVGGFEAPSYATGTARYLAAHWNGTAWSVQVLPASLSFRWAPTYGLDLGLTAIYAASSTDVWAAPLAADYQASGGSYLVHLGGAGWSAVPVPGPQEYGLQYTYTAIAGTGPGNIWAAGLVYNSYTGNVMPQIAHLGCPS